MEETPAENQTGLTRRIPRTVSPDRVAPAVKPARAAKAVLRGIYVELTGEQEPTGVALTDARGGMLAAFYVQPEGGPKLHRWNGGGIGIISTAPRETGRVTVRGSKAVPPGQWKGVRFGPISALERALVAAHIATGELVDCLPESTFDAIHITGDPTKDVLLSLLRTCNLMVTSVPATKLRRHRLI
jgi:hypothetical protein